MPICPEKTVLPDQISRFPDQITHFQGECETSERPTEIMKWERFLENAELRTNRKETRVQAFENA